MILRVVKWPNVCVQFSVSQIYTSDNIPNLVRHLPICLLCLSIYTVPSHNSVSRNSGISRYSGQNLADRLFIK